MRILVAVDFSVMGQPLLQAAGDFARRLQAELYVLHVFSIESYASLHEAAQITLDQHVEHLQTRLRARAAKAGLGDVPLHVEVIPGNQPAESILSMAEHLGADMIMMGSHSRTGLARVVLGSVAESVLRRSHLPVVIVPLAALTAQQPIQGEQVQPELRAKAAAGA